TSTRSTTVSVWKTSTTCFSSLYVASMARSWPKCFFAAWVIAFCSVSTSTERSMPLSLATWSRTMFRLTIGACGCGAAICVLLIENGFYVRLGDLLARNAEFTAVHVDDHLSLDEILERTHERLPVFQRRVCLDPHLRA